MLLLSGNLANRAFFEFKVNGSLNGYTFLVIIIEMLAAPADNPGHLTGIALCKFILSVHYLAYISLKLKLSILLRIFVHEYCIHIISTFSFPLPSPPMLSSLSNV